VVDLLETLHVLKQLYAGKGIRPEDVPQLGLLDQLVTQCLGDLANHRIARVGYANGALGFAGIKGNKFIKGFIRIYLREITWLRVPRRGSWVD